MEKRKPKDDILRQNQLCLIIFEADYQYLFKKTFTADEYIAKENRLKIHQ
jgi:hypothetical protein